MAGSVFRNGILRGANMIANNQRQTTEMTSSRQTRLQRMRYLVSRVDHQFTDDRSTLSDRGIAEAANVSSTMRHLELILNSTYQHQTNAEYHPENVKHA